MAFVVADSASGQTKKVGKYNVVTVPANDFLQSITVEASSIGSWTATVELFDANGDYLEELILSTRGTRRFLFRWGWDMGKGLDANPQYVGGINSYLPKFTPDGVGITLEMTFDKALDAALDKRTRSYPEGTKPSKIAMDIATERGWLSRESMIETNDKPITFPLSWSGFSDLYILDDLVGKRINAVTLAGKSYRWYFDTSGALHFHSDAFTIPTVTKTYRYARDASGEVLSFEPEDENIKAALLGGSDANWKGSNSNAGVRQEDKTTGDKAPKGAKLTVQDDATHRPDLGTGIKSSIIVPSRDPETFAAAVQAQYDRMRNILVSAKLSVVGTHEVRVGDYVDILYTTKSGRSHYLAGKYRVNKLRHNVSTSGWTTEFDLQRPGHSYVDNAVKTKATDVKNIKNTEANNPAAVQTEHRVRQ